MPVIPAALEAEIESIAIQGQLRQKVSETSSQKQQARCGSAPVIPDMREAIGRRMTVQGQPWAKRTKVRFKL
jgi:hypothetical protein